jgi:hypothetical protein
MAINKRLIAGAPTGGGGACTTDTLQILGDSSCIAYYKMADATDESGSYNGTATSVDFNVEGKYGLAGSFNGTSSEINLGNSQPLSVTQTGEISISLWVKTTDDTAYLYAKGDDSAAKYEHNLELLANGTLKSAILNSGAGEAASVTSTATVDDGNFHHVVVTIDNGSSMSLYIDNGTPVTTTSWSGSVAYQSTVPFMLGAFEGIPAASSKLNGSLDQIRIFNKAVSATEVGTLYNEVQCATAITPSEHFSTITYTGTGGSQATGSLSNQVGTVNFQPDFTWIKSRSNGTSHELHDSVRGEPSRISSDATAAASTSYNGFVALTSNGFSLDGAGSGGEVNTSGRTYVAWNWYAPTSFSYSASGSQLATTGRSNADAGFSIIKYTGGGGSKTIRHNLSLPPEITIIKKTSATEDWYYQSEVQLGGWNKNLRLNTDDSESTSTTLVTGVDASTISLGSSTAVNGTSTDYIAYCFHNVEGYSRIGSYVGTGASGNFVVTGFEPAFVLLKNTTTTGLSWTIIDNKRSPSNPRNLALFSNYNIADYTQTDGLNFHTNGFEILNTTNWMNKSGDTFIFMAFAQDADTSAPTKADSFEAKTYTGDGGTQNIAMSNGMKPDFVWLKERSGTQWHSLYDSIRGVGNRIVSNSTNAENFDANRLTGFNDGNFSIGSDGDTNTLNDTYISWNWKAADHDRNLATINQDGSITSLVSANPAAGFSIVKFTISNPASSQTIGHGLGGAPELIISKSTSDSGDWYTYHKDVGTGKYLTLNSTSTETSYANGFSTVNSTVWQQYFRSDAESHVAYLFRSITGYQKIGSYSGNQSLNTANQINFGFTPRFVLIKNTTNTNSQWMLFDSVRTNGMALYANQVSTESDYTTDLLLSSQGLEFKSTNINVNQSGATYIYLAIA